MDDVRAALRSALSPVSGAWVRASVDEAEGGYEVEIAIAPSREAVSSFVRAALPAFESHEPIRGVRPARFVLDTIPPEGAVATLESRAAACTASTSVAYPNSRTVVVRVPCSAAVGSVTADRAFESRIAWIADQLQEYGATLDYIGDVEPVLVPEGNGEALRMLAVATPQP